ncbi:MAG: phosphoribosylformylglycinamidine synthase subunit PurL [Candidatus Omnitrophica bacterium]|nr:phosphoribosylformylglycinamidine synthase subunit PurL [Candidatus Omnitrophota bacterium]
MIYRIDILPKTEVATAKIFSQVKDLGIAGDVFVSSRKVYLIEADIPESDINLIAKDLLIDPVVESYQLTKGIFSEPPDQNQILITYNPGVCDNIALSLSKAIKDLSLTVKAARTAKFYQFQGLTLEDIDYVAPKTLFNPLIEHILDYEKVKDLDTLDEFAGMDYEFKLITLDIINAPDDKLLEISESGCLSLSLDEMKIIQDYFKKLNRNPTDCELETVATLWSEHCAHKTFRGIINYQEKDSCGKIIKEEKIDNLLKATIMKATREINSSDCVSVFDDNSGVVKFDDKNNICFKVETHNHPSSLEPYGGASTGIGGVIRDILGTGCAARPFASIDVFCFSPWDIPYHDLPHGLLHPKRVIDGVVRGVRDYGNRMGIPTVAGSVLFDERFLGNPLVYCGTLGILPKEKSFKKVESGDLVILCGAKTGRDGVHGATFSSKELDEQTVALTSAVQIGNAIEEKKVTEAILRARDKNLFDAITDCGAGGISSAITELGGEHGVKVDLDKVPLKYRGLTYTEIWISESQERMVFFAKEKDMAELEAIFKEEDVELTVVGEVTGDHKLTLLYNENKVCELDMDFIFILPKLAKDAVWVKQEESLPEPEERGDCNQDLKDLLKSPNIACKDWILRQYDHEVGGGSVTKSIYGVESLSVANAAVVRPDLNSEKCVTIGLGINPFYSDIDPYWMAALAIDEAMRNVVSSGGKLNKTYILDNFSWGSPLDQKILGGLVRASYACYDFSTYLKVPFISGKDSLYNEYTVKDKRISIPGTLLISAVSIMESWRKTITPAFKKEGSLLYLIGVTKNELGASEYFRGKNITTGNVPKIEKDSALTIFNNLSQAIEKGLVLACHDLSEGGLAVTASEMAMSSGLGATIFLSEVPVKGAVGVVERLFSESPTRFLVEVDQSKKNDFQRALGDIPFGLVGCVSSVEQLIILDGEEKVIDTSINSLRDAWTARFKKFRFDQ